MRLRRPIGALSLLLVSGLALSACGTARRMSTDRGTSHAKLPQPRNPRRARAPAAPPAPRVGTAQRVPAPGTTLVVTVTSVINPLRDSGANLPRGTKPVGVLVTVGDAGPGGYDSSATGDFSLLSAAGPASPVFVPAGPCQTPLRDFMNAVSAGELRTGCIAFAIPIGQTPKAVRFSPDGGTTGHSQTWDLP